MIFLMLLFLIESLWKVAASEFCMDEKCSDVSTESRRVLHEQISVKKGAYGNGLFADSALQNGTVILQIPPNQLITIDKALEVRTSQFHDRTKFLNLICIFNKFLRR